MDFDWDPRKGTSNLRKHGVSFEAARAVFHDSEALLASDPDHPGETRFVLLGLDARLRCLVVVHSYDEDTDVLRIISARKATRAEKKTYIQARRV